MNSATIDKTQKLELLSDTEFEGKQGVSQAKYAEMRNMSRQNVHKHVKNGIITLLPNGNIDPEFADEELAENLNPAFTNKGTEHCAPTVQKKAKSNTNNTFNTARTIEKGYQAKLAELTYKKEIGEVVNAKEVRDAAFSTARKIRDQMLGIPDRVAALIAAEKDKVKVHKTLAEEIKKGLKAV